MNVSKRPQSPDSLPAHFPYPWCSDYGEDEYGTFMAIAFEGIRIDFRWIPPGTFWMGSPDDEEGRYDDLYPEWDETLHQVTLTKGYWLAETTCTQALWQAIMGENPSYFIDENRPVEGVSWDDSQRFIESFNARYPELGLRLPSEAEWEYACRAGTQTAFWFGDKVDDGRVHYEKGWQVGTLPAKALEPNPWGLYQMHGNVFEWCADWLDSYPSHAVRDPLGPAMGEFRVLRGGSCLGNGWDSRSALRFESLPANAGRLTGVRLARDP